MKALPRVSTEPKGYRNSLQENDVGLNRIAKTEDRVRVAAWIGVGHSKRNNREPKSAKQNRRHEAHSATT